MSSTIGQNRRRNSLSKLSLLPQDFTDELQECLALSLPLVIALIAEFSILLIDTGMLGLLGSDVLAAGSIGIVSFGYFQSIGLGFLSATGAVSAIAFGAQETDKLTRIVGQGFWIAIVLSIPAVAVLLHTKPLMAYLGQTDTTITLAQVYLDYICWGFPAALGFAVIQNVLTAMNVPQVVTLIMLVSNLLNVGLDYVFIFGKLGFPAMGIAGVGLASALIFWFQFLVALFYTASSPSLKEYKLLQSWYIFDGAICREISGLGWANAVTVILASGLFTAANYIMGSIGVVALAAHQIAKQPSELIYRAQLGLSYAATTRVGQMMGKQDPYGARRAGLVSILFSALIVIIFGAFILTFHDQITGLFIHPQNETDREVMNFTQTLLLLSIVLGLFNSIQLVSRGALQGLKDTKIPTLIGLISYWAVGMVCGWLLTFWMGMGGVGVWLGIIIGLCVASVILLWRFYGKTSDLIKMELTDFV